ncbi:MAG: tetratricopeptide repeat protein [Flammeovirgaceae bacterium]|nr:tetratricopeptide repeat protein [Flammeovirgaceae bacterium]
MRKSLLPIDPDGYSNSLYNLMYAYDREGNTRSAVESGQTLIEFDEQFYGVESEQYVYSMGDFIDLLLQADRWRVAEQLLKDSWSKINKDSRYSGLVEAKLGYVYTYTGLFGKATNCFTSSIPVIEQQFGEASKEYQLTLANYSALLMEQGKYDRAEEVLAEVINVIANSNWDDKDQLRANAYNNISLSYQALGQYEQAESSFEDVLKHDSITIGISHPDFAITLSNLGQLYTQEGKYENSEKVLLRALEILRINEESNTLSYASKLNNLAKNYVAWRQPARAIELLQESLKIIEKELGKKAPEYATVLFNLGTANLSINPSLAYAYLKKAELARRKVLGKRHPLYAETLEKLSQYQWKQRNKKEVNKLLKLVFENYYHQVEDFFPVLTEEEKSNLYYNNIRPSQEYFASWVCDKSVIDRQEVGELYNIALNTKGLILFATNKVRQNILESGDKTLIELYQHWEDEKELLAFSISRNLDPQKTDSLLNSSKILEKELSRRSAVFSKEIIKPKQTWQKVQAVLKPGEVAMEVIRFRDFNIDTLNFTRQIKYAFLLLTSEMKSGPRLLVLNNGDLLENRYLSYYRNGVRLKIDDAYSFDNYWKKIHEELVSLKCQTLFLSADGVYNLISIESIKNPATNRYIIEDLDIKNVTSTRELLSVRANNTIGQNNLLIGYPPYQVALKEEDVNATPFSANRLSKTTRCIIKINSQRCWNYRAASDQS